MRKQMVKVLIGIAAAVVLLTGGKLMYRHFVTDKILDGPVMENPAAPMLDLLSAEWMSEDGVWSARIEGETLDLSYQQDLVYSGSFFFDFDGDDLNIRTELQFYDKQFESEGGNVSGTIESLYVENCRLYLVLTTSSKEGEGSIRQQAVLDRVEHGKSAESESEEIQEVSEMAELVKFSWHQSAMSYDGCFDFRITSSEQESAAPRLYCSYTDPETGERIEIGEESSGFQRFRLDGTRTDSVACPPVPLERWEELADFLHTAELSPYHPPEPGLLDATDSKIQVTWREDGEKFTNSYSGIYAHELLELLKDIARETNSQKSGQNQPAPEGSWTCSCGQAGNTGRFCTECGQPKPAENKSEEIREVSEMTELVEFSWDQITIGDSGFRFHIVCAGQDPIDPRLSCRYMDREAHKIVQIGDEGSIETCPTIPSARWEELADFLRKAELPAYREPDPSPVGDMEVHAVPFVSKIQVTWRGDGEEFTNSYRGHYADELLELLQEIAGEASRKALEEPKPE